MESTITELTGLLEGIPSGAWVAISESQHKVMAYGADAQEVLKTSESMGEDHPLMMRVPDQPLAMFF